MKKRGRRSKMLATVVAISLGLNVQVMDDDHQVRLLTTVPLLPLPAWLLFWWRIARTLNQLTRGGAALLGAILAAHPLNPRRLSSDLRQVYQEVTHISIQPKLQSAQARWQQIIGEELYLEVMMWWIGVKSSLYGLGLNV